MHVPKYIAINFASWVELVEQEGLREAKKTPGYHDEPLRGKRKCQRSIRLSRAYRAFYIIDDEGTIQFVNIIEVNKHGY